MTIVAVCLVLLFPFLLCFHDLIISSVYAAWRSVVAEADYEACVDAKPQEERSLCLVNVGWSSVLCVYPQSSEWVAVDGTGLYFMPCRRQK